MKLNKKIVFSIKFIVFAIVFYALSYFFSFFLCNDTNAYSRILMHELHSQDRVDYIFCGASHVSHGIYPKLADELLNKKTFCTGTPSQDLRGTFAMLQETASFYDLEKVFVELEFAIRGSKDGESDRGPSESQFLIYHYLKNPSVKFNYMIDCTSPKYYLNTFFPLGRNKLISLNPKDILDNINAKLSGQYYRYEYINDKAEYMGKGCVFDKKEVANGTFASEVVKPIPIDEIGFDWKNNVKAIIDFCKKKNIALEFYANPSTDFYLTEKGNYDEYHKFVSDYLRQFGYAYHDFSFAKPEYLDLEDSDFSDDNHLNKKGSPKFTKAFCDFYSGKTSEDELFYKTYKEKTDAQPSKVYGLMLEDIDERHVLKFHPVYNHGNKDLITYDIYFTEEKTDNKICLAKNSLQNSVTLKKTCSGKIEIYTYYNGKIQAHATEYVSVL